MELQDKNIKEILLHSKLELPFSDFDQRMLQKIKEYEVKKKLAEQNKFFYHLCFLVGIILGIVLNYLMLDNIQLFVPALEGLSEFHFAMQLIYVVLIVLLADKLWKLSKFDWKEIFK